ncbi:hypothetical protein [Calothrix sp. 336/3]|uniref:hypothetical protein n=1 Tax=Calothrix sp. 336/3 TaxID=1337936 RepID=UPI0004E38EB4|nr:hypothetical protein [Calothrix sp. 336/3]AKG22214.1 hypothetical protein IJ00_13930 [Calothrix sp. 336/3]
MRRKLCFGMIAIPVFILNTGQYFSVGKELQALTNSTHLSNSLLNSSISQAIHSTEKAIPLQIDTRDEKIRDCIRSGNCKD